MRFRGDDVIGRDDVIDRDDVIAWNGVTELMTQPALSFRIYIASYDG